MKSNRPTEINRRRLVQIAGLGGGSLLIATSGAMMAPRNAFSAQDKVTLNFWTPGGSPPYCEVHNEIATDFSTKNPSIQINEVQCGTSSTEDFIQILLGSVAAGNPPDATILWDTPVSLGARGALTALDDYMQGATYAGVDNWPAALLSSCQFEGQTFGLPVTAGMYGIWYNQELFESKGIPSDRASFPKTWDELRLLSKEFTSWDGDTLLSAGCLPWNDENTLAIWSALNGSQLYDADAQMYTINNESNIAMMEYAIDWLDEEYKGDINLVNASGSWDAYPNDAGQPPMFQSGQLAMCESGSWMTGDFYNYIEPVFERWDVANYPVGPGGTTSVTGYWPNWIAMPKGSDHPDEAFAYVDYMCGEGVIKWFDIVPDMPTNSQVPELVPQLLIDRRGEEFATEIMKFFRDLGDIATPMWDSPVQGLATDKLRLAIEKIMTKTQTPTDALTEAQNAAQAELESVLKAEG
jgi:ABC-type glycerol-3-phosphate transport system substrate-binding protein